MGERTTAAIVEYMRKKAGPPTTYLESDGVTTEFRDTHDVVMLGFFDNKDKEEFRAFEAAAGEVPDVHFGHVFDNGIRTLLRAEKNSILLFKKFDEKRVRSCSHAPTSLRYGIPTGSLILFSLCP